MKEFLLNTLEGTVGILMFLAVVGFIILGIAGLVEIFAYSKILAAVVGIVVLGAVIGNTDDYGGY